MDANEMIMAITIVAFTMLAIVAISIAVIIAAFKRRRMEIEVCKMAIEKGLPAPKLSLTKSPISTLKAGLVWIAGGVGLFILIITGNDSEGIGVTAIPILIGLAMIISHVMEKKALEKENSRNAG